MLSVVKSCCQLMFAATKRLQVLQMLPVFASLCTCIAVCLVVCVQSAQYGVAPTHRMLNGVHSCSDVCVTDCTCHAVQGLRRMTSSVKGFTIKAFRKSKDLDMSEAVQEQQTAALVDLPVPEKKSMRQKAKRLTGRIMPAALGESCPFLVIKMLRSVEPVVTYLAASQLILFRYMFVSMHMSAVQQTWFQDCV